MNDTCWWCELSLMGGKRIKLFLKFFRFLYFLFYWLWIKATTLLRFGNTLPLSYALRFKAPLEKETKNLLLVYLLQIDFYSLSSTDNHSYPLLWLYVALPYLVAHYNIVTLYICVHMELYSDSCYAWTNSCVSLIKL
jgi:hypothetical protein